MVPDGWNLRRLGEIAQIGSGGTPDRGNPGYWGGDIPWVTTGEIKFNEIISTAEKITEGGLNKSAAKLFEPGTLLMAMYGQGKTRGQVAKLAIRAATNQACAAISLNADQDPDFFFHVLSWKYDAIRGLANSGSQQNLSSAIVKAIEVPVPEIHEQRRIARLLSCWDRAITTTESLLANARMRRLSLLSAVMPIPSTVGTSADPTRGGNYRLGELFKTRRERGNAGLPTLSVTTHDGLVDRDSLDRKMETNLSDEDHLLVRKGDIVYNMMRMWQGASGLADKDGLVSPAYVVLAPRSNIDSRYAAHLFKAPRMIYLFWAFSYGLTSDRLRLYFADFAKVPVTVPSLAQQNRAGELLDATVKEIALVSRQLAALRREKAMLMQQLLTGKRRVKLDPSA